MPRRRGSDERPTRDRPSRERPTDPYWEEDELTKDPEKEEAIARLREQTGGDGFVAAVDAFRAVYGMPEPFDLLQIVFERHTDPKVRAEALENMDAAVDRQADSTKQVFKTRVKLLQMTAREPELKKVAVRIARARGY